MRCFGFTKSLHSSSEVRQEAAFEGALDQQEEKQARTPWHREGSDTPPVARERSAGATTKGKLLTTPSRLLKLIIPLTSLDESPEKKDVEPLALLVHPHQPLSYLERLIQSELPTINNKYGEQKVPNVYFRAEDSQQDEIKPSDKKKDDTPEDLHEDYEGDLEETKFDGVPEKTGKLGKKSTNRFGNLGDGSVESYSGLGREGPSAGEGQSRKFVRWSSSTEIGDFIRDAARGKEFAVEIEGAPHEIRIGVPSFNDRTHYLRLRLRKTASKIIDLAAVKKECDMLAHKGAQRWAMGGAGALVGYWYLVYRITFETDLGWDVMEPVTYLVGLSTLICGYLWFLYHNREVSYRSALNLTISRRQTKLYADKGFDLQKWEALVDEANGYRREIKQIANEYDVDWDEREDEKDERVVEAMAKVRREKKEKKEEREEEGEEE